MLTDSAYKLLYDVRVRLGDHAFCYWIFPNSVSHAKSMLNEKNNYVMYESDRLDNFDLRENSIDGDLLLNFSRRFGDYFVDAIITTRRGAIYEMSKLVDMVRFADDIKNTHDKMKVNMPIVFIEPNAWKYNTIIDAISSIGYYLSYPVFLTNTEKKLAIKYTSDYLSGALLREIDKRAIVANSFFKFDEMKRYRENATRSKNKITLFYGARINKYKKSKLVFEVYAKLYAMYGEKVNVIATTITGSFGLDKKIGQDYWGKYFRMLTNCSWEDYIKYSSVSHVSLVASASEALSSSYVEQLFMGVIMVLPRLPWAYEIVPENYPFLYNNMSEAYAILHYVIGNYVEAYKKFEPAIEFVFNKFSKQESLIPMAVRNIVTEYRNSLMNTIDSNTYGKLGLISKSLGLKEKIGWDDFMSKINKYAKNMKVPQSKNMRRIDMLSDYEIYLTLLMKMGYKDNLNSIYPELQIEKKLWSKSES